MNFKIITIEGNIGSGKSTLLEKLKDKYSNNEGVIFLKEPVDEWEKIKDSNGTTMLAKFYENQEKYSFAFQMMAYISRLKILRDTIKENQYKKKYIIITERCLYTDKFVFAKMLHDQGKIEDVCYEIYLNWFDEFSKDFPVSKAIYVKTDPEICYERIHKRAREGEEIIPIGYLKDCHKYHDEFIEQEIKIDTNCLLLDGNLDIYEDKMIIPMWIGWINSFINFRSAL